MKAPLPDDYDAFRQPREIRPGCVHMLGCRCTAPFWLREPTKAELRRFWQPPTLPTGSREPANVKTHGDSAESGLAELS